MLYWDVDLSETNVLFWWQKRTRKPPAIERLGGGEAMKAPVGLSSRQSGLRSKCRVFSAARTGIHEKGATRPFQTPKEKSKRKKASLRRVAAPSVCFATARILLAAAPTAPPCFRHWRRSSLLRFFLVSPVYGFAENSKPSAFLSERDIIYFYNSEVIS
jgi:hypothetical protein